MKKNVIYITTVALMVMACVEENFKQPNPFEGDEVLFSATLTKEPVTRTIYGEEVKYQLDENGDFVLDENGNKIELTSPEMVVNWVHGDKIKVWASEIASRNEAEYSVNTNNQVQNYAVSLDKTGDYGIQWGTETSSDFCAIYPSDNVSKFEKNGDAIIASTSINATQNNVFAAVKDANGDVIGWDGTHFGNDAANPSMQNAIMFARTADATPTDENGNPKQVNLHFKPYTTVLKFRFLGYTSNLTDPTVYIQNITVKAPEGVAIAGDFNLGISGTGADAAATVTLPTEEGKSASDSIRVTTILPGGTYIPLKAGQYVDFNVYTIPQSYQMNATDKLWTVTIYTQGHGKFTYKMKPIPVNNGDDTTSPVTYNLTAGEIHKVKIPSLPINSQIEWNPENWITQIPVPVYISELSVPGAWYCFDSGYQNTTDLATLYKAGIRAFNIDCRITKKGSTNDGSIGFLRPQYYEKVWDDSADYPNNAYLACAGTETNSGISISENLTIQNINDGTYVINAVKDLIALAQENTDEYIVIVFTFAEKAKDVSGAKYGSVNPIWIMNELNNILNTNGIKEYLYTDITKDTTIDDITKKQSDGYVKNVIVKINHCIDNFYTSLASVDNDNSTSTPNKSVIPAGLMGSFGSMSSNPTYNLEDDIITNIAGLHSETTYTDYFTTMRTDAIYIGTNESDLQYCYHQAQNTSSSTTRGEEGTGIPTLGMRMDAIDDIIAQSKSVYDNAQHDHWFQMGIGGSIDGDNPSGVSNVLNPYLYGKIMKKMDTDPSPVGLVLMNHATSTTKNTITVDGTEYKDVTSQDLVQAIIEMNGKFYLNRVGGSITTGDGTNNSGNGTTTTETKNAAYAVVGDNAF